MNDSGEDMQETQETQEKAESNHVNKDLLSLEERTFFMSLLTNRKNVLSSIWF